MFYAGPGGILDNCLVKCVMSWLWIIVKVIYDTKTKSFSVPFLPSKTTIQKNNFWKLLNPCWFFGLPCVIEHLNHDQWSGYDTLTDKTSHLDGHIFIQFQVAFKENFLVRPVMSRPLVMIKVLYDTKISWTKKFSGPFSALKKTPTKKQIFRLNNFGKVGNCWPRFCFCGSWLVWDVKGLGGNFQTLSRSWVEALTSTQLNWMYVAA